MLNYRPLTAQQQAQLDEWEVRKRLVQAKYEKDALRLGYAVYDVVFCGGEETPIGEPCRACALEYDDPHTTHAFAFDCICSPCYRIVFEVDEWRELNSPLEAAKRLAAKFGI